MKLETSKKAVVVIGGGVAGIAAAVKLAQAGLAVTLVETRKRLGGRATSFVDPANGQLLDNCQHVLLGCCTNLLDLYRRLGVADQIVWHRKLYFTDGSGAIDELEADDLPAPFHMSLGLLRFSGLTLSEKLAIARGMASILRLGPRRRGELHHVSFAQWLSQQRQPAGAVQKFWAVITVGAVNELPARMAADYAIQVFQDAFLSSEEAYVMGLSAVPLTRLYDAAETVIRQAGGTVLLGTSAARLVFDSANRIVTGLEIDDGRTLTGDAFVTSVPFDRLAKLCDSDLVNADVRLQRLNEFEVSPIVGIHLWFAAESRSPIMDLPHLVLTRSPLHWIFNKGFEKSETDGRPSSQTPAQHLHGVISAAHDLVDMPAEDIIAMAVREVRKVLPAARDATLVHARVIKEKRATFSAQPGVDALRPPAGPDPHHGIANLFLAGDWTDTGWPATMEGAARSGYLAAGAALKESKSNDSDPGLVPDLPADPLYRLLAGRK